jgi:hypothetical protein
MGIQWMVHWSVHCGLQSQGTLRQPLDNSQGRPLEGSLTRIRLKLAGPFAGDAREQCPNQLALLIK